MKRRKTLAPLLRAVSVVSAVAVLATGATFAALQSQDDTLTGNNIRTATANLQISTNGTTFADSVQGFNFSGVEPGGGPVPVNDGYYIWLKNTGDSGLALRLSLNGDTYSNPDSVNLTKVFLILSPLGGAGPTQTIALSTLLGAYSTNTPAKINLSLAQGQVAEYRVQIQMSADAVTTTTTAASLTGIDFIFSGLSS